MSIYSYLEKVALDSMPRGQFSDAAIPYAQRKKQYKKFVNKRARSKKPSTTEYVPAGAIFGGIAGGLVGGASTGSGVGVVAGGLMGAGIGALGGLSSAYSERGAIEEARKVVKGGKYDKALQDEITAYRRYKQEQKRAEKDRDRLESRLQHQQTMSRLDRIENRQQPRHTTVVLRRY